MASNHVPTDQVPLQGQNVYDPSYQHIFSSVDRYGTPSWEAQLQQHSGLPPTASGGQAWHHNSFSQQQQQQPFNAISQSYGGPTQGLRTASPYQYGGQFSQQAPLGSYAQPSNVDPSLGLDPNAIRQQQQSPYQMPMRAAPPQSHGSTVTPQALQHNVPSLQQARATAATQQQQRSTAEIYTQQRSAPASFVKPVPIPEYEIPKGRKSGGLHVVDQAALAKATNSVPLNKFVTLGSEPFHLTTNRTALPVYLARQSLKDLKKAGADSKKLRAKQLATKSQSRALKSNKRPELKREVSDSASSTDSSDYDTDSSDEEEEEQMPVPASRPEDPDAAVRYDVIKATWYPSTSAPSSDQIKTSMREIWEVLNTIQKRWRADTKAVTEAEEQKKTGELPVLKSRVTSQRDLLKSALGAALESAHPDVLYQLGHIKPFLYLCYQFLANRFRSKDYDGPLSAVIYEVLSRCGTLTSEVLEETKLLKALASMKKHANEKHKAFIQKVMDGAVANSKKAKASPPPRVEPAESKGVKRSATEAVGRSSSENLSMKKPKAPEASVNAKKDVAGAKTVTASTTTVQKRPGERAAAAPAPVKTRVSQVTNKPSGIFASLTAAAKKTAPPAATTGAKGANTVKTAASATKEKKPVAAAKPAFSFAQTMASLQKPKEQQSAPVKSEKPLPVETEQEKEKRERKERRRHLRVSWRNDATLVEIKYFDHEADDEEMHHKEDHLVRDAGDIGGEGHMFKQHKELDLDDDDDEDTEQKSWNPPSLVDFSVVRHEERERNYTPYGGGFLEPTCPEKEANVQRENATLMVYYSSIDDIPPSPKEPLEQAQEDAPAGTVIQFGTPPDMVLAKCPQAPMPAAAQDFSHLENLIKQLSATNAPPAPAPVAPVENVYTPPPPPTASWDGANLQNILNSITNNQAAPQPAPPVSFPPQPPMPQPGMSLDIAAIIANMQAASGGALPPPPPLPTGFPPFPFSMAPQPQQPEAAAWSQQMPDVASYQAQYNQQTNGGVKRQRDESNGSNDRNQGKRLKNRGDHKPHKVLACKFFNKGQCNKGENCTYIHDKNLP